MRFPLFFALCCVLAGDVAASEGYPYVAPIAAAETPVLSGPGSEYFVTYVTSTLRQGESVEVYYETEDWCAIRPPIGSFSWVSARYVELAANGIGTVVADGLASRIGSEETEQCDTVQVKLKRGEKVLVLDRRETPENAASPLWYKIAPPSGEFRWIPRAALFDATPALRKTGAITQVVYETENPPRLPSTPYPKAPQSKTPQLVQTRRTPPVDSTAPSGSTTMIDLLNRTEAVTVEIPAPRARQAEPVSNEVLTIPPLSQKLASSRPDAVRLEQPRQVDPIRSAFDRAFEELQQETRTALTRPTEDWVFQTLIERGDELYEVAPTDADLEKVYHLVETLQRTWDVRKEIAYRRQFRTGGLLTPPPSATPLPVASSAAPAYARNNGAPAPQPTASSTLPASYASTASHSVSRTNPPIAEAVPGIPNDKSRQYGFKLHGFDVVGRLGEFEDPPHGYPPYAVADENERILCLISPAVGVELREHVGKHVGINGILGFYEKANQPKRRHIMVQEIEVIPLKY